MMPSPAKPASELPAVDARLVAPESGYEIIDGRVVAVPPAYEPHAERHSKLSAVLEACAAADYNVALDMLTRTSHEDDIAPDASVYPIARDPGTGGRQLEELAFEVVSTQSLSDAARKAQKLSSRGVRRVFALDIERHRVLEWSPRTASWEILPDSGQIDDRVFAAPVPIDALLDAAKVDDAVAHALLAKHNPVLVAAIEQGRAEGLAEGRAEGKREALLAIIDARELHLTPPQRERIASCNDPTELQHWLTKAATASTPDGIFD